ncbi:MAG TPA: hypothetical protein EYG30_00435 [Planctomycetes bacterium]|nr:hypothetical protein [Planctomycetota bacterium]HIL50704.1 hypothetical protein [Planctomycetota bacterium]
MLCDTSRGLGLAFGACVKKSDGFAARFTFVISPEGLIEQTLATRDPARQAESLLADLS